MGTSNVTFNYDSFHATAGQAPVDLVGYATGLAATVKDAATLERTGYTFSGWTLQPDGSGTTYSAGSPFVIGLEARCPLCVQRDARSRARPPTTFTGSRIAP